MKDYFFKFFRNFYLNSIPQNTRVKVEKCHWHMLQFDRRFETLVELMCNKNSKGHITLPGGTSQLITMIIKTIFRVQSKLCRFFVIIYFYKIYGTF